MKLTFIGSGSAFTVGNDNFQSNILLDCGTDRKLLFDCGTDARHALHAIGVHYSDITDVFISHLHADHMGGLEWLGFTRKFDNNFQRPRLFISKSIAQIIWDNSLAGSMNSIEGENCTLETYFDVHEIERNGSFEWEGITFRLVQTIHIMNGYALASCHGLLFQVNNKMIYITADTQFAPYLLDCVYQQADIIFHDCETANVPSGVHPHYDDLCTLPDNIKQKMWLYHYNPGPLPDAEHQGFRGFVKRGQSFEF